MTMANQEVNIYCKLVYKCGNQIIYTNHKKNYLFYTSMTISEMVNTLITRGYEDFSISSNYNIEIVKVGQIMNNNQCAESAIAIDIQNDDNINQTIYEYYNNELANLAFYIRVIIPVSA